jgi:hypothetical protein
MHPVERQTEGRKQLLVQEGMHSAQRAFQVSMRMGSGCLETAAADEGSALQAQEVSSAVQGRHPVGAGAGAGAGVDQGPLH